VLGKETEIGPPSGPPDRKWQVVVVFVFMGKETAAKLELGGFFVVRCPWSV